VGANVHIPDGYLSTGVWAAMDAMAVPAVVGIARQAQHRFEDVRVPLLGVMGAFVFAAQMINFPAGLGTSAHLLGGAFLAITLGGEAATIVMTAIIAIQALVFQDGGILVMGANILNMAVVGVWAGYLPFRLAGSSRWRNAAIFTGGALSVLVSAICALAELKLSGLPSKALGASAIVFLISAPIEGAITLAVVKALEAIRPGFVRQPEPGRRLNASLLAAGLVSIFLAAVGVLYSSNAPDGIEQSGVISGLASRVKTMLTTPFSGYEAGFLSGAWLRKATAGLAGLVIVYAICMAIGRMTRKRSA
jgi:cobalt/nickel transport system permease protein